MSAPEYKKTTRKALMVIYVKIYIVMDCRKRELNPYALASKGF